MPAAKKQRGAAKAEAHKYQRTDEQRQERSEKQRQQRIASRARNRAVLDEARKNQRAEELAARSKVAAGLSAAVQEFRRAKDWVPTQDQIDEFEHLVTVRVPVDDMHEHTKLLPGPYVLWRHIQNPDSAISQAYARGKDAAVAFLEEEIEKLVRRPHVGVVVVTREVVTPDGDIVTVTDERRADATEHRKIAIDGLKWTLAHIRPKKHGAKADPEGGKNKPNEQLESLFASLMQGPAE